MPAWPGSAGVSVRSAMRLADGDPANVSVLSLDVHCGTHIDAPLHTLTDGAPVGSIAIDRTVGEAFVVEVLGRRAIRADDLASTVPRDATRILLRTDNSHGVSYNRFDEDFCALTADAAEWLVEHGATLIGIDAMSVQRYDGPKATHDVLLRAGVVILEGLNLRDVAPGAYRLLCLPLAVPGLEGAPARAVLEIDDERGSAAGSRD